MNNRNKTLAQIRTAGDRINTAKNIMNKSYKILALTFCLCMVAFTGKTKADDGPTLVATINAYAAGGGTGGALNATWNDPVVIVFSTAPITGATEQLTLDIDDGITVLWTASLSGSRASSLSAIVHLTGTGTFEVAGGQIVQTGAGRAIQNNSTGTVTVSGGTVEVTAGTHAIWNNSTGAVNVTGGTVGSLRSAIYNSSSGLVTISQANPSNPTLITSSCDDAGFAAIYLGNADIGNTATRLIITGGTVENTDETSAAITICNNSTGAVEILGGTVKANGNGRAIYNAHNSGGVITISEIDPVNNPTLITSANETISRGTIHLIGSGGTDARLIITGGTVENTANSDDARAIYNNSTGAVNISGGTVFATQGRAIHNQTTGAINISGGTVESAALSAIYNNSTGVVTISEADPNIPTLVTSVQTNSTSGTIVSALTIATDTAARLIITGGTVENTANTANVNAIYNGSTGAVEISGGTISATLGTAIRNNITGVITISEADPDIPTLITSANITPTSGTIFLASSGTDTAARLIITGGTVENTASSTDGRAIYNGSTGAVEISGGTVSATLGTAIRNISTGVVTISEADPNNPTLVTSANTTSTEGTIHLGGTSTDTAPRLIITGGTITNTAYSTNARVIYNGSTGEVVISGGTVSLTAGFSGMAIRNNTTGAVTISGGTVQSTAGTLISNGDTGTITITGGTLSSASALAIANQFGGVVTISEVDPVNNPTLITTGNGDYTIMLAAGGAGSATRLFITGGTVENTSSNDGTRAIYNNSSGAVEISGGLVRAKTGYAVHFNNASADLIVNGTATLFAWGEDMDDVINHSGSYTIDDDAVVIAWNEAAGNTTYTIGTDDDLFSDPVDCVIWDLVEELSGISYSNGLNEGFIEVADVTVTDPCSIPISDFPWLEGFEDNGTNLPTCWTVEHVINTQPWTVITGGNGTPGTAYEGTYKARFEKAGYDPDVTKLVTPPLQLNSDVQYVLTFWHTQQAWDADQDELRIYYKDNYEGSWNLLAEYTENVSEWTQRIISLPFPSEDYYIAFEGLARWGRGVQLDYIMVEEATKYNVTFSVVNGNGTLTATVDDNPISTGDEVYEGSDIIFTATPDFGYQIKEWTFNSEVIPDFVLDTYTLNNIEENVTITVEFEVIPPEFHTITVTTDGNGTASANVTTAQVGTTITLTAEPNSGYQFAEWQVISGGITINDVTANPATFIMPDNDVEVMATFEVIPTEYHTITVTTDGNGTASANVTTAQVGTTITLTAEPNSGYQFAEWQVISGGITINDVTANPATFVMPDNDVEVMATFEVIIFAPVITTETLPDGEMNESYSAFLEATGDAPITWSIVSGSLPPGLDLNTSTGEIFGMPTIDGTFTFTVMATNDAGTDTKSLSIKIEYVGINLDTYGRTSLQVYPNPTTGVFFVRHCGLDPQSPQNKGMLKQVQHDAALEIFDVTGRVILREPCTVNRVPLTLNRSTVEIDISHLSNGIYFVKVGNEMVKIVKK